MTTQALDALRREVIDAVYGQRDWLETLTVALPPGEAPETWIKTVETMLADLQLDCVDVKVEPGADSAPWIRGCELGPGWN